MEAVGNLTDKCRTLVTDTVVFQLRVLQHAVNIEELNLIEVKEIWGNSFDIVAVYINKLHGKLLVGCADVSSKRRKVSNVPSDGVLTLVVSAHHL